MLSAPGVIVPPSSLPDNEELAPVNLNVSASGTVVPPAPPLMLPTFAKLKVPVPTLTLEALPLLPVRMLPYWTLPALAPVILQVPVALVRAPRMPGPPVAKLTALPDPPIVTGVVAPLVLPARPVSVVLVVAPLSLPVTASK